MIQVSIDPRCYAPQHRIIFVQQSGSTVEIGISIGGGTMITRECNLKSRAAATRWANGILSKLDPTFEYVPQRQYDLEAAHSESEDLAADSSTHLLGGV